MRRPAALLGAGALTGLAAFTGLGVTATPAVAAAEPMSLCTTTSGVVLAVDFGHWGGPILRACGTTPTTGYDLLNEGGWRTTGDQHDGPAFICRIGYSGYQGGAQYPTPAQDPCVVTPPASAYWSYWHADPGQNTWTYSQLGAMSYHPEPGSVDLWIFGGTNIAGTEGRPAYSPDLLRAHNTAPTGPTAPATQGSGSTGGSTGGRTGSAPHAPAGGGATSPSPSARAKPSGSASASASVSAPASGADVSRPPTTRVVDAVPAPPAKRSSGSGVATVVAIALGASLAAAAGVTTWRRRRAG
ncbi:hypothetical protein [Streptomyces sp. ICBB 8177]|uniref:hypothetical protein n=1 Tax=Streptomyces sp. ICBB 8177 TaxID=563922 RepID=UPI000D682643|nr:hypothetical protein [Streptomyces sp. ICBB 8177]PWI42646.1 hypothetical protein CK485_10020 [Streptomyces sp. ICBB 8177]